MPIKTLAIIGCGAASITFFRTLVDIYSDQYLDLPNLHILIFEKERELGPGFAYQDDFDEIIINRPVQNMSANPDNHQEFFLWLKHKRHVIDDQTESSNEPIYTSRKLFGLYLNEILEKTIVKACLFGMATHVIYDKVTRIIGTHSFIIETESNKIHIADFVIICTGHNQPKDIYNLSNSPKYINNPYPTKNIIHQISRNDCVGILGNSLTAIDSVIALKKIGFIGKTHMFSRKYVIPRVRGKVSTHQLQCLTTLAINKMVEKQGNISLRGILRLFRKELRLYDLSWKFLFTEDDKTQSFHEILLNQLNMINKPLPWQAIIPSTNSVSEYLWHQLIPSEKALFLKYCQRTWLNHRSSIPPINARLLIELAEQDRLFMHSGIRHVDYNISKGKYIVYMDNDNEFECDWIINATGPSKYIGPQDELAYELIKQGIAKEHLFGGIDVDFETSSLLNKHGQANPRIRLIGHNTVGVYQYTSSLELIAKKSMKVANNFVTFMKEISHDQITKSVIAHFDRTSHLIQVIA